MQDSIEIDKIITTEREPLYYLDTWSHERESNDKLICQPYDYLSGLPSNNNNIRSKFIHLFDELFFKDIAYNPKVAKINEVISILHNSSLLIDDIEDNSSIVVGFPRLM